jgi:uncharacterized membrane protein
MPLEFFQYAYDFSSFAASVLLIAGYHSFLRRKIRTNPTYTVQTINAIARTAWVETIMREKKDILAVQTLRNSTMAATFLASTSVLLIIGVKILTLLLDLFVAFFSFSMSIRIFNHVGYMINVPLELKHRMITPAHVATHLNRAGSFYSIGMRAYYFTVPLVFWLFGPHFMLIATIGLLIALYRIDRAPKLKSMDYSDVD